MSKSTIGERLKEARGDVSQAEITKKYGLGKNTLSNYETGVTPPKLEFLMSFIKDFGLDANWLLFGKEQAEKPELSPRESALIANYRASPEEARRSVETTVALFAQPKKKVKKAE